MKNKNILLIVLTFAMSLFAFSCSNGSYVDSIVPPIMTQPSANINNSTEDFHNSAQDTGNIADRIGKTTDKISDAATNGELKTPENVKPILSQYWKSIFVSIGELRGEQSSLYDLKNRLLIAEGNSRVYQKNAIEWEQKYVKDKEEWQTRYEDEKKAKEKAQSDATKELRQKYTWISIACFSVLVISIVLAFSGFGGSRISSLAIGGAIAGAIGMIISIALVQTVAMIPWIVGGIGLLAAILIVWRFITLNRESKISGNNVLKLTKINNELVHTVEAGKVLMSSSKRKELFGNGPCVGKAHTIQSEETREFVKQVRAKMTNKAPSVEVSIEYDEEKNKMLQI